MSKVLCATRVCCNTKEALAGVIPLWVLALLIPVQDKTVVNEVKNVVPCNLRHEGKFSANVFVFLSTDTEQRHCELIIFKDATLVKSASSIVDVLSWERTSCLHGPLHVFTLWINPGAIKIAGLLLDFREDNLCAAPGGEQNLVVLHWVIQAFCPVREAHGEYVYVGALTSTLLWMDDEIRYCKAPIEAEVPVGQILWVNLYRFHLVYTQCGALLRSTPH